MKGLLVGYGSIGRRHLANLHEVGVGEWAVVRTGRSTIPFEPPCPAREHTDLAAALRAEKPTFAVVANPTNLHVPTALACVEAGCHVLMEKPVSDSLSGLDELAAAARANGAQILVGFQFRFHPALATIAELVRAGRLGTVHHVRSVWGEHLPSWHPWEDYRTGYAARADLGGGAHHTICHPFDYLRMLFGDPHSVSAVLTKDGPLGLAVAEAADVTLRYPGGLVATVHLDYWAQPATHHVEIVGTEGTVQWDFRAGELRTWTVAAPRWDVVAVPGVDQRNTMFLDEARHFLDVVKGDAAPVCGLDDGIAVARLCAAIERSDAVGGVPLDA